MSGCRLPRQLPIPAPAPYDSSLVDDDAQNLAPRITEYAAMVDEANRRTLDPILVEFINDCRRGTEIA